MNYPYRSQWTLHNLRFLSSANMISPPTWCVKNANDSQLFLDCWIKVKITKNIIIFWKFYRITFNLTNSFCFWWNHSVKIVKFDPYYRIINQIDLDLIRVLNSLSRNVVCMAGLFKSTDFMHPWLEYHRVSTDNSRTLIQFSTPECFFASLIFLNLSRIIWWLHMNLELTFALSSTHI